MLALGIYYTLYLGIWTLKVGWLSWAWGSELEDVSYCIVSPKAVDDRR